MDKTCRDSFVIQKILEIEQHEYSLKKFENRQLSTQSLLKNQKV